MSVAGHLEGLTRGVLLDRPLEGGAEVLDLAVQSREVLATVRAVDRRIGPVASSHGLEVAEVALTHRFAVWNGREALGCVRPHRFQHPEPGGPVFLAAAHEQALGDEPVERVDAGAGDRLRGLHGGAAGEHREAREARFLVVAEQAVAPVDRCAQRLLAGGRVAWPCAESVERAVQARGDLCGREQPAARRRQLDRQREPVDPSADLRDRVDIAVAYANSGSCARARSQNSATASTSATASASSALRRSGSASGGTG